MQDKGSSRTALVTAYLRAAHQIIDLGPCILDDPVALTILGPGADEQIRAAKDKFMSCKAKALRAHVVLRSRYAEDRLESSIERGIRQYVLIGAGFDTFALRQPNWATRLRIIEVDHPNTQRQKRLRISNAGMHVPGNVDFVSINFEQESLEDGLTRVGVHTDKPTFFSWLGVTMYLTEAAIDSTLRYMAAFPGGSEAVISFLQPPAVRSMASHELAERVSETGEPFISYFTCERIKEKLMTAGFSYALFLTRELSAPLFAKNESSLSNPNQVSIVSAVI